MKIYTLILLNFFGTLGVVIAQSAGNVLPTCAINCMNEYIPQSTCLSTDQTCICQNLNLQSQLSTCVTTNCTVKQALTTQNYTATACSWPVRDQSPSLRHVSIPLAVVATLFVAARVIARLPAFGGQFGADDWFIIAAWALSIGFTIALTMLSYSGLGQDVFRKLYIPTVWITKISILLLYLRLFPGSTLRSYIKISLGLCSVTVVCLFIACVFKCWPVSMSWNYWDGEHSGMCTSMAAQGWANSSLNMFADIVVLVLPLPTIWKLQLSIEKKLGITAMFSVGLFVTVVSMVRLKTMKYFTFSANPTWDFVQLSLWSAIEIYVGIICACMPGMRAFYTRILRRQEPGKTGTSQGYATSTGSYMKNANDTFGSANSGGLRSKIRMKNDFELMVTENDSTEDLTKTKTEAETS